MKRLAALVVTLFLITVTSAFAAGLDVQAENVESFTTPVSITTPDETRIFYLRSRPGDPDSKGLTPPGLLAPEPQNDSSKTRSKRLEPGGSLTAPYGTDVSQYHFWDSAPFSSDLHVKSPTAELTITQVGGAGEIGGGLFDCASNTAPNPATCTLVGASTTAVRDSGGAVSNITTITFENFDHVIPAQHWLRLVVYSKSGSYNIQWGYTANRPASLELTIL